MKKTKRFFGLVLALGMILSALPAGTALASDTNLLQNGGFEVVETRTAGEGDAAAEYLWPAKVNGGEVWNANSATGGLYGSTAEGTDVFVTTDEVHSGTYALKVIPDGTNYRRIWQKIEGLMPGSFYEASVWVMISGEKIATAANGIDLIVAEEKGTTWGSSLWASATVDFNSARKLTNTNGKWTMLTVRWQQPAETEYAHVALDMMKNDGDSIYYFDDAFVRKVTDFSGDFETVTTEKLSAAETILWPQGLGMYVTTGANGAYAGEVQAIGTAHSGRYALQMTPGTTSRRANLFVPNLTAGKTYKIKAYMKIAGTLSGAPSIYVGPTSLTAYASMWKRIEPSNKTETDWKELSSTFTVPEGFAHATINFNSGTIAENGSATVYFDDVTVTETNVTFKDENGAALTAAKAGKVSVEGDYINQENEEKTVKMMVAVYTTDANHVRRLSSVQIAEATVAAKSAKIIPAEVTVEAADQTVQVMFFDAALTNLSPLYEKFVLPAA